jgi:hypothetical protein
MFSSQKRLLIKLLLLFFLLSLALNACNMPRPGSAPTQSEAGAIYTAAAQTVQAQLTQVNRPPSGTSGTPFFSTATTAPGGALTLTPSPSGTQSASSEDCDQAEFEKDVTYPDGTDIAPGTSFVKTWRLTNAGTCTWTSGYTVVFTGGEAMGAPASVPLSGTPVAPGESVDVSVTFIAPDSSGTYRSEWMLRNASNQNFGVGDKNKPFWVDIDVVVATGIVYDFIARASSAEWVSGTGSGAGSPLNFGGEEDNPNGVAKIKDNAPLETGASSGKLLLTYPRRENNGYISGTFPVYTVQPGDQFQARLGFLIPDGDCGAGKVVFQLGYVEDGSRRDLQQWTKSCSGRLQLVDLDLSSLKGKSVRFVLEVRADGSSQGDYAIWNSALIEN